MATNTQNTKVKAGLYAQAIIDAAFEAGGEAKVYDVGCELYTIKTAFLADSSLARFTHSQTSANVNFDEAQAHEIIDKTFDDVDQIIKDVFVVMLMNLDFKMIVMVVDKFADILVDKYKIIIAEVFTVVELDDHLRQIITDKLQREFDCMVFLHENIDERVLGGIVISANGRILDCSVASKIRGIQADLLRFRMAN